MSQATPVVDSIPLRVCNPCEKETCSGEVVAIDTKYATEVFVRCAPLRGDCTELDFEGQVRRFYNCLPRLLGQSGGDYCHVVLERAFFEDFDRDMEAFQRARAEAYQTAEVPSDELPALTCLRQPPCHEPQKIEMQIYAVIPKSADAVSIETAYDAETRTTAKLLTMGGRRHLYIADIKGIDYETGQAGTFREQSDLMFARCATLLEKYDTKFTEVLRTWCYLKEIDDDYAEFNLSRNDFFKEHGVKRLPASTGIRAGLWPNEALCGMDLYVLLDIEGANIELMHTPTLNEADEYGSAFARGMKIDLPEKTVLHISGTASIDETGATVHLDDAQKQLERMLLNVRELLAHQGASFDDVTQIATFLKHREYYDMCKQMLLDSGIRAVPNTFVEAGVCRPDLLCEMEAIAIIPKNAD